MPMLDKGGKTLLSLIIGKAVPDRPELHYIRRADEDPVYVVAVKTDKLSGKFGDWIEKNLLNMSSWDLKQVSLRDYSVDMLQGALEQNGDMVLSYDDAADKLQGLVRTEAAKRIMADIDANKVRTRASFLRVVALVDEG